MYEYGMRLRPVSMGAQPKGFVNYRNDVKYYNVVTYDRMLTEQEIRDYELDYLGEV